MSHRTLVVRAATIQVGCGAVLMSRWADRPETGSRIGHWPVTAVSASLNAMALITPHRRAPRLGMLVGGSVYGAVLTAAGLGLAHLALASPLTSLLSANQLSGAGQMPIALVIRSLSLIAGGALLLAGTNRLAVTLARLKTRDRQRGPGAQALASMSDEVVVVAEVVPNEGRAIPELAIGPFGAAVIHALPSSREVRLVGASWESRTPNGWLPMENPIELAMRDAERVRRWFSIVDLDFVVRVYAALVVADQSLPRSATCAVLTPDQMPTWIAALPPQRRLTAARRARLRALAAPAPTPTSRSGSGDW
jgi:hypothetical protein